MLNLHHIPHLHVFERSFPSQKLLLCSSIVLFSGLIGRIYVSVDHEYTCLKAVLWM